MKTRSSSGVGAKVDLEFDIDSLRISDCDDEEEQSASSSRSTVFDQIKRNAGTTDTKECIV